MIRVTVVAAGVMLAVGASQAHALSLNEAIRHAVVSNPRIGEAQANRRAVDRELRQAQGALLPQVRATAYTGSERFRIMDTPIDPPGGYRATSGRAAGVTARQILFDGFASVNEIYRQMARSDAAAWRTFERSELVALDVAESYIDIIRFQQSLEAARQNVRVHQELFRNVEARFSGGRAGQGDLQQVRERLQGAQAVEAELRIRLGEAQAQYRQAVGLDPVGLRAPSRLTRLPPSRDAALQLALQQNPTIQAARADADAARREFDAAAGRYLPTVALEGRAFTGRDTNRISGPYDDVSVRVTAAWDLYTGGINTARRQELGERMGEAQIRVSSFQRAALESIDRAWAARVNSGARIDALAGQVGAAEQVVRTYRSEYELGQRTLIDLLNAQNNLFNARINLASARGLVVFSDYQLLAATGQLLAHLQIEAPREAQPTPTDQRTILPQPAIPLDPALTAQAPR